MGAPSIRLSYLTFQKFRKHFKICRSSFGLVVCRFVGTVLDILSPVWPSFRPKSGSKLNISGRILHSFRGPCSSAESGQVAWRIPAMSRLLLGHITRRRGWSLRGVGLGPHKRDMHCKTGDHHRPAAAKFVAVGRWCCILFRPLGAGRVYTTTARRPQTLWPSGGCGV